MIVATISFSLIFFSKISNFIECLPVILFAMLTLWDLNCFINLVNVSEVNMKRRYVTNPCFCIFGNAFRVLHFYCTHFQAIFGFN